MLHVHTGKSVSEALILESVMNMTRDYLLNYKKSTSLEHVVYKYCFECQNKNKKNYFCIQHFLNLYLSCNSMNNHSSYYELNDAKMRASEKDLPVIYLLKNP